MNKKLRILIPVLAVELLVIVFLLLTLGPRGSAREPAESEAPETAAAPLPSPEPSPVPVSETAKGLQISELMAVNKSCLPDAEGACYDWVELCNTGEREIDLARVSLSNDPEDPGRYPLSSGVLPPGERLLVFCGCPYGAPFSLHREGGTLVLGGVDGSILQILEYGASEADCSLCFQDGESYALPFATPGYPNTEEGYESFLLEADRHGSLVISEIVGYNKDFSSVYNQRGKLYDWIELQNVSETPIRLEEYCLTDDRNQPEKSRLEKGYLAPGERILIYCSGDSGLSSSGYRHVDFKLHTGERVYVRHDTRGLSDSVCIPLIPGDGSYGRMEGEAGFFYFEKRSPGAPNGEGFRLLSDSPVPDLPQGIYEDAEDLSVSLQGPGEIRYTLDGSVPTRESPLFTEPIPLEKTSVIRAVCFEEGKLPGFCTTLSYIVNEGHSLPVISVVCDGGAFSGLKTYVGDKDREIPADAAFFEGPGKEPLFQQGCSLKLHGASSRKFTKKSYKLIFQDRFGGDIRCDVFQRGEERDYHALLLRGGTVAHMYIVKDSLASLTALEVTEEPLTLDARYCIVYFNGSYYGIYCLREAYCEQYAMDHTGSSRGNVEIEHKLGVHVLYDIFRFLARSHMENDEEYDSFCQGFDPDAFAAWVALEAYFLNEDPDGNIRFIRGDGTDWKWTAALFDLDLSLFSPYGDFHKYFENSEISMIAGSLLKNPRFRESLLRSASALYHNGLGSELTRGLLNSLVSQLDPEMPRNCQRWNEPLSTWEIGKDSLYKRLGDQRTLSWIESLQDVTRASDEEIAFWFGDLSELEAGG